MRVCDHAGLSHLHTAPAATPLPAAAIPSMAADATDDNPLVDNATFPTRSILGSCSWAVLAARPAEVFSLAMVL